MMGRSRVAILVLLAPAVVLAQPKPNDAQKQEAGDLVKKAIAKSQAGDHLAAIDLYNQAYMIIPQPLLLSNIASEYEAAGKPVEALKYFCRYLDKDPNGSNVSYATAQAKSLQIQLGNQVDDDNVCKPPAPKPTEKPTETPKPTPKPDEGVETALPTTPPPEQSHSLEYTGIGMGAVGLATLGVGIYYGIQAKNISDSITNHDPTKPWPTNITQMESDGKSDQTKQIAFTVSGGILTAAGVVIYFVGRSHAGSHDVAIAPVATPTTVGLAVGGGF